MPDKKNIILVGAIRFNKGLIKDKNGRAVVANNIYKSRFVETFFDEANVPEPGEFPMTTYGIPDGKLDMKRIFLDFSQYITQIGVKEKKRVRQITLYAFCIQFLIFNPFIR